MKIFKIVILFTFISFTVFAQHSDSIIFTKGSWNDILSKAKSENKPIFVDCYTTWCSPCKWMVRYVFNNDTVASYYNQYFICYASDMEKDDGIMLKKKWNIQSFPTYMFLDAGGYPIHKTSGKMEAIEFINEAKIAFDSTMNFYALKNKYDNGDRSSDILYNYSMALSKTSFSLFKMINLEIDTLAGEYFKTQSDSELLNHKNWLAMNDWVYSVNDTMFYFVLNHKSDFIQRYDSVEVYHFLYQLTLFALNFYKNKNDMISFNKTKTIYLSFHNPSILKQVTNQYPFFFSQFTGLDLNKL